MTITSLGKYANSGLRMGPEETLRDVSNDIEEGGSLEGVTKMMVISRIPNSRFYSIDWRQCGMTMEEIVTLLETTKMSILNNMGYNVMSQDLDDL